MITLWFFHPKTKTPCSGAASGASGSAAGASGGSDSSMSSSSSMSSNICRARRCSFGDAQQGFLVEHRFCRNALRKVVFPPSKDGGQKTCVMFFAVWQLLGGYDQGWPKNDVVFFWLWVHKLFLFLVLDLNHQILHWNTPCFTNIRIASSILMNPSLCASPSCKHLCH